MIPELDCDKIFLHFKTFCKWCLVFSPVVLCCWIWSIGGPIFLEAETLTELLKGFIMCTVGIFIGVVGFLFIGTSLR